MTWQLLNCTEYWGLTPKQKTKVDPGCPKLRTMKSHLTAVVEIDSTG